MSARQPLRIDPIRAIGLAMMGSSAALVIGGLLWLAPALTAAVRALS